MAMPTTTDSEYGERLDDADTFGSQSQSLISKRKKPKSKATQRVKKPLDVELKKTNKATKRSGGKSDVSTSRGGGLFVREGYM